MLELCAERLAANGDLVSTLQVGTKGAKPYLWHDVQLNEDGKLDFDDNPMKNDYRWRFKPGPLTADDSRKIDGLITTKSTTVLKTDNIIAEALLGQADALDSYATALQELPLASREADISSRKIQTRRTSDALDLVKETASGKRVEAYKEMLVPPPQIQVVPVASASNMRED